MRLVTYSPGGAARLGAVVGQRVVDLSAASSGRLPSDMLALIDAGVDAWAHAREVAADTGSQGVALDQVKLLAPIPRPRKNLFCLGLNYRDHADEAARAAGKTPRYPEYPIYFTKPPTAVIGPEQSIEYDPSVTRQVDWEAELTLVIGRGGRDIPAERALGHVFGYTVGNDVSARDLQFRHGGQWFKGKSLDTFAPIGPWIVTADELPDPHRLDIRLRLNGAEKQHSNTRELIFDVPAMIAGLSAGISLESGDLIMTGTPDGVGFARTPPEFLQNGDVVEVEIEGIGILRNTVATRGGD